MATIQKELKEQSDMVNEYGQVIENYENLVSASVQSYPLSTVCCFLMLRLLYFLFVLYNFHIVEFVLQVQVEVLRQLKMQ